MHRRSWIFAAAAAFASLAATGATAQALTAQRTVLTSYAASQMVAACMAVAARDELDIAIAVVDPSGNLLAFQAAEGASERGILTSQLKAKTAARWQRSTADLFDRVNNNVNRAPEFVGDFPQPGGFPIFIDNALIGAVGAGGGVGSGDDECAMHAIQTIFGDSATTVRAE